MPLPLVDGFERREAASLPRSMAADQGELVRSGEPSRDEFGVVRRWAMMSAASRDEFGVARRWAMMSAASKGAGSAGVPALSFLPLTFLRDMTCG